jgi:IS5 family transposase
MERSLVRVEGGAKGWACSNCRWRYPVPTLLSGEEGMAAYDRLATVKFREHECEVENSLSVAVAKEVTKRDADTAFAERARMLIKRGYKPKVAVELVLHEMEIEHRNDPRIMEKARSDAEDFLMRVRKGLI